METKKCPKCNHDKDINEFHLKRTENRRNSWCKACVYELQKDRWISRKNKALELFGNKCLKCGYNKCRAALEFHHQDPNEKDCDWRVLRNRKWSSIIEELKKCVLLCSNCHREEHADVNLRVAFNTDNNLLNYQSIELEKSDNLICEYVLKSTGHCPQCGVDVYGTKFCSVNCVSLSHRRVIRPSSEELNELIQNKMPWVQIGKKYRVSDHSVKKWARQYGLI